MSELFDPFATPMEDLEDLLVVSASAGTGKTWMIAHLASRWLLEGDRDPGGLLMVTFSRASASELRSRLRLRLTELRAALAEGPARASTGAELPWRRWLAGCAERIGHDVLASRIDRALSGVDDVHARTIHSFAGAAGGLEDGARLTSERTARVRAVREVLTRRAAGADPDLLTLLDALEDGAGVEPAGVRLERNLLGALSVAESAGGAASGRVQFWRGEETPAGDATLGEELFNDAADRLEAIRATDAAVTFDALISALHREVTPPHSALAQRLREQFGLVLIDEFQDTDALQWEIFDAVFRRGTPTAPLVLVGDPKQAIYGFRGGDVTVFERVRRELLTPGPRRQFTLDLTVSHRSSEGLLRPLNALFAAGARAGWTFTDGEDPVVYEPVTTAPALAGVPGRFTLRVGEPDGPLTREQDVVGVVRELLDGHGVAPRDIAILCRQRFRVADLHHHLERAGIRAVSNAGGTVFDSVAATQLTALLFALGAPEDQGRANLLSATWFASLGPTAAVDLAASLARHGVAALGRLALDAVLPAVVARDLSERHWTDLEHLFDLLACDHPGPTSADVLGRALRAGRGDDDTADGEDPAVRRIESDEDAVSVMTIHRAKGQEFPVVLVPEIESGPSTRPRVSAWTIADGVQIDAGSVTGHPGVSSPAAARARAEDRRLIYVALTRAQRLLVAWVNRPSGQWPALVNAGTSDAESTDGPLRQPYGVPLGDVGTLGLASRPARANRPPTLLADPPRLDAPLRRWSFSALDLAGTVGAPDDLADADVDAAPRPATDPSVPDGQYAALFGGRRGAALGSAVHAVFEHAVGQVPSTDRDALAALVRAAWRAGGIGDPAPDDAAVIARCLARPLGALTHGLSLDALGAARATAAELRFTLPLTGDDGHRLGRVAAFVAARDPNGPFANFFARLVATTTPDHQLGRGYLTGSLDLVCRAGDPARYVVIDYKTNLLPEPRYEPADLLEAMAESGYPVQGLFYLVALHRFLRGRLAGYDATTHLGGVGYYYVRGAALAATPESGLAVWTPPAGLVAGVSDLLDGSEP